MDGTSFGFGALVAVIGLIMLIAPEATIRVVVVLLGATAVINGIYDIMKVRSLSRDSSYRVTVMVHSLLSIAVGLLAVFLPFSFFEMANAIFHVMLYVLAIYLLVAAVLEFFIAIKLRSAGLPSNAFLWEAVACVIIAVFLFILPHNFAVWIVRILGLLMMLAGSCYAVYAARNRSVVLEPEVIRDATEADDEAEEKKQLDEDEEDESELDGDDEFGLDDAASDEEDTSDDEKK